ncbi:non-canonical purine NTP pyrophosphatase, partial [Gammaproteobacteria bacterium]|nr:non-canonical purine NTP pyrophosphatase [Gammaproteobacteria bacterium]
MKIVFASSNSGKITELTKLLNSYSVQIIPQKLLNIKDADETGLTFVENAIIKARNACLISKLPSIADDSGLEVSALNGSPGIYSSRYANINASSKQNIDKLLINLKNTPKESRQARFYCAIVYMEHAKDPTPIICEANWNGLILDKPIGVE